MSEDQTPDNSKQENTSKRYLEFDYAGQRFEIHRSALVDHKGDITKASKIEIIDKSGLLHGEILGTFIKHEESEIGFRSESLKNKKNIDLFKKTEKLPGHISGLIRESIAQIIFQGKIKQWISSGTLLEGGTITYEKLLLDPRLTGTKNLLAKRDPDTDEARYQYIFSKK